MERVVKKMQQVPYGSVYEPDRNCLVLPAGLRLVDLKWGKSLWGRRLHLSHLEKPRNYTWEEVE